LIREIEKELKAIGHHKEFTRLLADESLQKLSHEEVITLQECKCENKTLQLKFDKMKIFFQRIYQLEERLRILRGEIKKNIPNIEEK